MAEQGDPKPLGVDQTSAFRARGTVCDLRLSSLSVHSHNEFLLAILTRCQILVSTPGKGGKGGGQAGAPGSRAPALWAPASLTGTVCKRHVPGRAQKQCQV